MRVSVEAYHGGNTYGKSKSKKHAKNGESLVELILEGF